MGEKKRFSKALALAVLDGKSASIAAREKFDRGNGTSQLSPKDRKYDEDIRRAVEYGRMRAFEQFAESIEEGFSFDGAAAEIGKSGSAASGQGMEKQP